MSPAYNGSDLVFDMVRTGVFYLDITCRVVEFFNVDYCADLFFMFICCGLESIILWKNCLFDLSGPGTQKPVGTTRNEIRNMNFI